MWFVGRYADLIFDSPSYTAELSLSRKHKPPTIRHLDVYVASFDQSLNLDTDESYTLTVSQLSTTTKLSMQPRPHMLV